MLDSANLSGASLILTQLHGASLKNSKLTGASLKYPYAWRARLEPETIEGAEIVNPTCDKKLWTEKKYHELKETIERNVPAGLGVHMGPFLIKLDAEQAGGLEAALKRIESLNPSKPFEFEAEASDSQKRMEANAIRLHKGKGSPEELRIQKRMSEQHPKTLAAVMKDLICSDDANAVY